MAEGNYEPYHVPQQSRRDKLRSDPPCAGLLPLYDPAHVVYSDLLPQTLIHYHHHQQPAAMNSNQHQFKDMNLMMGFASAGSTINTSNSSCSTSCSNSSSSSSYMDPQPYRGLDQSFSGGEALVFKPEQPFLNNYNAPNNYYYYYHTNCGQSLSLTLSSQSYHHQNHQLRYDLVNGANCPVGPFVGYASVMKASRFLKPAQELLEFCTENVNNNVGGEGEDDDDEDDDSALFDPPVESLMASFGDGDGAEIRGKKSKLISMLDEVYRKYKQCRQQLQAVIASFKCVSGLANAAPYAYLALKTLSKHFRCLKNVIMDQLHFTDKVQSQPNPEKISCPRLGGGDSNLYHNRRAIHNVGFMEHNPPIWRPQRGLPDRAVSILRAWLFDHFLHPYPTDTDKIMLAKQTGLSRNQVSNWFINARVRLWKPMVEEIHMLESQQAQKGAMQKEETNRNPSYNNHRSDDCVASTSTLAPQPAANNSNPSTSTQRVFQESPPKRVRNELASFPTLAVNNLLNSSFVNSNSNNNLIGATGSSMPSQLGSTGVFDTGGSSIPSLSSTGVSLTLGLHQHNGMGNLSEPFPIAAAQRFGLGLEVGRDGYVIGSGFDGQNRHVMGGQLLHDFVG